MAMSPPTAAAARAAATIVFRLYTTWPRHPTTAAAARATVVLLSGFWTTRPRHQQQ
jgi:hypothetical protein